MLGLVATMLSVAASNDYAIDGRCTNRSFDGVGALSGGGATSKLLPSYPEPQRSEVLDALFKPNHLASLQILKVEIGGDADSTEGSEGSHMHVQDASAMSCVRGYEFWLAAQAKKRNPNIRIYGLPWGFPHWLAPASCSASSGHPLNAANRPKTVKYIANWVACAKSHWNITVDFLGPWNEKDADVLKDGDDYYKALRKELDSRGMQSTRLVAGDVHSWIDPTCAALNNKTHPDAELEAAIDIIGKHYPSTVSSAAAKQTGKPLWSSEDYAAASRIGKDGGRCEARIINQNWVNGLMTATVAWNLVTSYFPWLGLAGDGLMTANSPWSGHYSVDPPIFSAGHTAQFTTAGRSWLLSDGKGAGSAYLKSGGSFVTYLDKTAAGGLPLRDDADAAAGATPFTLVIEKVQQSKAKCGFSGEGRSYNTSAETAIFKLSGGLETTLKKLTVWRSNFGTNVYMQRGFDIAVGGDGSFSVDVAVDDLITVTNTKGQSNGNTTSPPADHPFPNVRVDDFESYPLHKEAAFFAQASGAFEVAAVGGKQKQALAQKGVGFPVKWLRNDVLPATQTGPQNWRATNVSITAAASLSDPTAVFVAARVLEKGGSTDWPGLYGGVSADQKSWFMAEVLSATANASRWLAHGPLPAPWPLAKAEMTWRKLSLSVAADTSAVFSIDGKEVHRVASGKFPAAGNVAIGTASYSAGFFDDFVVSGVPGAPSPPAPRPPSPPPSFLLPKPPTSCQPPQAGDQVLLVECSSTAASMNWRGGAASKLGAAQLELLSSSSGAPTKLCLGAAKPADGGLAKCSGTCAVLEDCATAQSWIFDATSSHLQSSRGIDQCLDVDLASSARHGKGQWKLESLGCKIKSSPEKQTQLYGWFAVGKHKPAKRFGMRLQSGQWAMNTTGSACMAACGGQAALKSDDGAAAKGSSSGRSVRWWMGFGSQANNLALIDAHPKAFRGIYTYIGAGVETSGSFDCPHNASFLRNAFAPYWARGLTVTPALALTNASVTSGAAEKQVAQVAAFAKSINVSGLMLDFEPATSAIPWVKEYASYVAAFTKAMHAEGLKAEMCVSSWGILDGHFLPNGEGYGIYAKTGVDTMMSMAGTYYGNNVTKNLVNVDKELKQGVSISQLAAGIGTQIDAKISASCPAVKPMGCKVAGGQCYNWTETKLTAFITSLEQRGVQHIDFWRADIDEEGICTEPWYFAAAKKFLAGCK